MGKKQRVHSLTGRIDDKLMRAAFKAVKRNRGAAGIDKVSIQMFERNLDDNLASLMKDLNPDYSRGVGVELENACFIGVLLQVCGFASSPTT